MSVNNRTLHGSLQRDVVTSQLGAVGGTAAEIHYVHTAPRPQLVEAIKVSCLGLTGAATANFMLSRFVSGGQTIIGAYVATLTLTAFGTSGLQSVSFLASMPLIAGDAIQVTSGGSNVGVTDLKIDVVVKNLEDIRTNFGTSY